MYIKYTYSYYGTHLLYVCNQILENLPSIYTQERNKIIKTHNSELRGLKEAGFMALVRVPTLKKPSPWHPFTHLLDK